MIAALLFALASAPQPAAPDGLQIGSPVTRAFKALGDPDVRNTSVGHVWIFNDKDETIRVTSDDNGNVVMIDVEGAGGPGSGFAVPGTGVTLNFGGSTANDVRNALLNAADFATTAKDDTGKVTAIAQGYRIDPDTELVLLFDPSSATLDEAFYGERAQLALAGLISGQSPAAAFHAAELQNLGAVDYTSPDQGVAYVRIEVGSDGKALHASIFSSSGDQSLDQTALAAAMRDTFTPATADGKAVASVFFYRANFVHAP